MTDQNNGMSWEQTPKPEPQPPAIPETESVSKVKPAPDLGAAPKGIWEGLRPFLACNPFYLLSAALLLYSFYLVSADRAFWTTDVTRLFFNLGSLQLYEILVVGTAVWLARRAIWYDSTLLAGLENLLILVPFMLISEAALIDLRMVWVLCAVAGLVAACRLGFLKRGIQQLHFPARVLGIGMLMLMVNAALPVVYRVLHQSKFGTAPDWGAAYHTNQYIWWLLLPALCAMAAAVPFPRCSVGNLWPQRRWLPLGMFTLWLAGTGVHLYSLAYIYDFVLRPELLAPTIWTLSWLLWMQVSRWASTLKTSWKNALWILPAMATLLATSQPRKEVFFVLTALNVAIYISLYNRNRVSLALHLALISGIALLGALPAGWGSGAFAELNRGRFLAGAGGIYLLACIAMARSAKLGLLGGILAAVVVGAGAEGHAHASNWAVQAGLVFLLLHSFCWNDSQEQGANLLRWLAALGWITNSLMWAHFQQAAWQTSVIAACVLCTLLALRQMRGNWGPPVVVGSALVVLFVAPGDMAASQMQTAPAGLLAVIGSFVLFGLGTLGAITKHRWGGSKSSQP